MKKDKKHQQKYTRDSEQRMADRLGNRKKKARLAQLARLEAQATFIAAS